MNIDHLIARDFPSGVPESKSYGEYRPTMVSPGEWFRLTDKGKLVAFWAANHVDSEIKMRRVSFGGCWIDLADVL